MSKKILPALKIIQKTLNGITKQQIKDSFKIYREGRSLIYIKKGAKDITAWYSPDNIFVDEFADIDFKKYAKEMSGKVDIGYIKTFLQKNKNDEYDVDENGKYQLKSHSRFVVCLNATGKDKDIKRGFLFRQNGEIRVKNLNLFAQTFKEPNLKTKLGEVTSEEEKKILLFIEFVQEYLDKFFSGKIKPLATDTQDINAPDIDAEFEEELSPVDRILKEEREKEHANEEPEDE